MGRVPGFPAGNSGQAEGPHAAPHRAMGNLFVKFSGSFEANVRFATKASPSSRLLPQDTRQLYTHRAGRYRAEAKGYIPTAPTCAPTPPRSLSSHLQTGSSMPSFFPIQKFSASSYSST